MPSGLIVGLVGLLAGLIALLYQDQRRPDTSSYGLARRVMLIALIGALGMLLVVHLLIWLFQ